MAKFCTNCGKELEENAAICLNCGVVVGNAASNTNNSNQKEKKKGMPTWAIVLIVIGCFTLIPLILFIAIMVFAYNIVTDSDYDFDIDDYIEETVTQKGTIGSTLETEEFKITLTEALIYDSIGDGSSSYHVDIPDEGKEYLVFFLNVENISDESQFISSYYFDGYVDGYSTSVSYLLNDIDGTKELGTTLAAGKKTQGFVAFEVDTNWQEFELRYSDVFDEYELVYTVKNEDSLNIAGA